MRISVYLMILMFIVLSSCDEKDSFTELRLRVKKAPAAQKERMVRIYLRSQRQIPIINDTTIVFVLRHRGRAQPYVTGDMVGWKADTLPMKRIEGTPYWYKRIKLAADARVEYKFVLNGKYFADSLNSNQSQGGFGVNSVVLMPRYIFPLEILYQQENVRSVLDTLIFVSQKRHRRRLLFVYRHPAATATSPLVVFNDGSDYLNYGKAQIVLDNLIADGVIPAINALFVTPLQRMKEYWLNEGYLAMLFEDILPRLRAKYDWQASAPLYLGGVSLGAEISLLALKNHGRRLAGVFSQSAALQIEKDVLLKIIAALPEIQPRLYLDYGTLERQNKIHEQLSEILTSKDVRFKMNHWHEGHNWGNWRGHLKQALQYLLTKEGD